MFMTESEGNSMLQSFKTYRQLLFRLILGIATCLLAINLASPASSITAGFQVLDYQQQAETVLLAQGVEMNQGSELKRFAAILSGSNVYPKPASTQAIGTVGAALRGNRLIVRGSFRDLSSSLRDYATDPVNPPNPNITSAVHVHRGTATENGPFQYALQVDLNPDGRSGMVRGDYTLTDEQLQALNSGRLYVDLHTTGMRAGELRGILKP
jgi:hypothetical protein